MMKGRQRLACQVTVMFLREGTQFIAYCPGLDLSTCGKTFEQARERFDEVLDMFVEDLVERGTLEEVLTSYGWKKVTTPTPRWVPPTVVGHLECEASIPVPA